MMYRSPDHRAPLALAVVAALVLLAGPARAQSEGSVADVQPPILVQPATPAYPELARQAGREADVSVLVTIAADGTVAGARVEEPAGSGFDEAAVAAARRLVFRPATRDGAPVAVEIRYTFRFRLPAATTTTPAALDIQLVDGAGAPIAGALIRLDGQTLAADDSGRATAEVPAGTHRVHVSAEGFAAVRTVEEVGSGEKLSVRYRLEPAGVVDQTYQTEVWAAAQRTEVARVTLVGDELTGVAGTMGDPLRVVSLLPGATTGLSGLGYPIIRGALPGDSSFEIDGIEVPMLYHMMFGTAVLHPRLFGSLSYEPGGYDARTGRVTGGRVSASIAPPPSDSVSEIGMSLAEASAYRAQRIGRDTDVVAAARAGTLGLIAKLIDPAVTFHYVDYQARVVHRLSATSTVTATALGVHDVFDYDDPDVEGPSDEGLGLGFHRGDVRYDRAHGAGWLRLGLQGGYDHFGFTEEGDQGRVEDSSASAATGKLYGELGRGLGDAVTASVGFDADHTRIYRRGPHEIFEFDADVLTRPRSATILGAWTALEAELGPLTLSPSVRVDHYRHDTVDGMFRTSAVDPRLGASVAVSERVALRGSAGRHSGLPRLTVVEGPAVVGPVPASQGVAAQHGLSQVDQVQLGVELELPADFALTATGYHYRGQHSLDFSLLNKELAADPRVLCDFETPSEEMPLQRPLDVRARASGLELLLRRKLGHTVTGWLSYSLSRNRRKVAGLPEFPYDYDQPHVFNAAAQYAPGGGWTLSAAAHVNSGRPVTLPEVMACPGGGYDWKHGAINARRLPTFWRVDVRAERRFVFTDWQLSVFLDFFNASLRREVIELDVDYQNGALTEESVPLFLPMIGARGAF